MKTKIKLRLLSLWLNLSGQRTPADRAKLRELKEIDRRLDRIEQQ